MQSRNEYLEALGIPDFLYSKVGSVHKISAALSCLVIELNPKDSFCVAGKTRDLLVKMLATIELNLNDVHLASIEKSNLDAIVNVAAEHRDDISPMRRYDHGNVLVTANVG